MLTLFEANEVKNIIVFGKSQLQVSKNAIEKSKKKMFKFMTNTNIQIFDEKYMYFEYVESYLETSDKTVQPRLYLSNLELAIPS